MVNFNENERPTIKNVLEKVKKYINIQNLENQERKFLFLLIFFSDLRIIIKRSKIIKFSKSII